MTKKKSKPSTEEQLRLQAIKQYEPKVKDDSLDYLVRLASTVCGTEVSLVTILDKEVQWFKATHGIDISETPREVSFCNYAIEDTQILEIKDTLKDKRVASNPLVVNEPHIRFYAGMPLINNQGYPLGTLCVIDSQPKSLTEDQKEALRMISKLALQCLEKTIEKNRAEDAEQLKDEFIGLMSKEMLSPMNNILGLIEMTSAKEAKQTKTNLKEIKSSAEKLHTLINDMLDFQQIKGGKVSTQEIAFDLNEIIRAIKGQYRTTKTRIKLNYDLSIPQTLLGDPQRMEQVLNQIVEFSVNKSSNKQVKFSAEIVKETEGYATVKFKSIFNGKVDEENLPSSPKELFDKGGLSISNDLIEMLGGKLVVKNQDAQVQMSFIINFNKTWDNGGKLMTGYDHIPNFKNVKVLLVDDLEPNRIILGKFLEKWDVTYDMAEDGDKAVEMALANDYDLILMDLRMPGTDGFEATKQIKARKKTPVIALTASLSTFDDKAYIDSTIDDLLAKPFHPMDLKQKIYTLLNPQR